MKHFLIFVIAFYNFIPMLMAQNNTDYLKKQFINDDLDTLSYRILLPEKYDSSKEYPFILILHGSGERGNDNELQLTHGASLFLKASVRKSYPAFVVFPQCFADDYWSNVNVEVDNNNERVFRFAANGSPTKPMKMLQQLTISLLEKYSIDMNRVYVGGLSMGGMGTFEIVSRNPDLFAAAFPICGGAHPDTAEKLINTNWWVFHGEKDNVVPHQLSIVMANAIKSAGGNVKFTLYPEANHDSWTAAFAEPELLPWLFSHKKN